MPVRIVISLAPDAAPPPQTGPAVYAALLHALREVDPAVSRSIHNARRRDSEAGPVFAAPPIAVTPIIDTDGRPAIPGAVGLRIEVGVLADELTAAVLVAVERIEVLRVARCLYRPTDVSVVSAVTYPALLESGSPVERAWRLRLLTPFAFATSREDGARRLRVLPEPEWVFGSLATRWRALAGPVPLPDGLAEAIRRGLAVADWSLQRGEHLVVPADPARGRKEQIWSGSIGTVTYQVAPGADIDPPERAALDALVRFSWYGGIGDRTNVGMGFVRPEPSATAATPTGRQARTARPARTAHAADAGGRTEGGTHVAR